MNCVRIYVDIHIEFLSSAEDAPRVEPAAYPSRPKRIPKDASERDPSAASRRRAVLQDRLL